MNFNHTMAYHCHVWCSLIISCHKIKSKWKIEYKKKRQYLLQNVETDTISLEFSWKCLANTLHSFALRCALLLPQCQATCINFWGSEAQFKCQYFHVLNLIPIKVVPNDKSLMVHSDVELCWSDSIHFHDVQWSKMLKMPCGLLYVFSWVDSN